MLLLSTSNFNIHNPYFISTTSISSSSSDSTYFSIDYHPLSFSRALTFIHFSSQSSTTSIQSSNVASYHSTYTASIFIPFSSIPSSIISCKSSNDTSPYLFSTFCSTSLHALLIFIHHPVCLLLLFQIIPPVYLPILLSISVNLPDPRLLLPIRCPLLPPPLPLFLFLSTIAATTSPSPPSSYFLSHLLLPLHLFQPLSHPPSFQPSPSPTSFQTYSALPLSFSMVSSVLTPTTYTQASKHSRWPTAMDAEIQALLHQQTWTLVPPPSLNKIGCKWFYKR